MTDTDALKELLEKVGVSVKPLEWAELGDKWSTVTSGRIQITQRGVLPFWSLSCSSPETDLDYDTLEEAKAAAQADHERRIISALIAERDG